jgi:hypothetical protein
MESTTFESTISVKSFVMLGLRAADICWESIALGDQKTAKFYFPSLK